MLAEWDTTFDFIMPEALADIDSKPDGAYIIRVAVRDRYVRGEMHVVIFLSAAVKNISPELFMSNKSMTIRVSVCVVCGVCRCAGEPCACACACACVAQRTDTHPS